MQRSPIGYPLSHHVPCRPVPGAAHPRKGVSLMALSISAAVLMLVIVVVLIRRSGLKLAHAIVCALLGFYLASSSIAPSIQQVTSNVAGMINGLKL